METQVPKFQDQARTRSFLRKTIYPLLASMAMSLGVCLNAGAQSSDTTGLIQGVIFVVDSDGPSYVAGAKVILRGTTSIATTVADQEGRFSFSNVEPGTYTVEVSEVGLQGEQTITVEAGSVVRVVMELNVPEVKTSVAVTASSPNIEPSSIWQCLQQCLERVPQEINL